MGLVFDLHVHTERYSACGQIDPGKLLARAVGAGLDGLTITEHHYQWTDDELDELRETLDEPGFVLLAGFEYASTSGDLLVYGLDAAQANAFPAGLSAADAIERAHNLGGACIGAHPTRAGMGFGDGVADLPFDALEVRSCNLQPNEQRLAVKLAETLGVRAVACSDAHRLENVGAWATTFDCDIRTGSDLQRALRSGRFHIAEPVGQRTFRG